ncbi:hypothetical protein V8C26DRAFT_86593 [Trichoderma gracile]
MLLFPCRNSSVWWYILLFVSSLIDRSSFCCVFLFLVLVAIAEPVVQRTKPQITCLIRHCLFPFEFSSSCLILPFVSLPVVFPFCFVHYGGWSCREGELEQEKNKEYARRALAARVFGCDGTKERMGGLPSWPVGIWHLRARQL